MKNVLLILLVFNSLVVFSQKGTIRGTVIEDATGESFAKARPGMLLRLPYVKEAQALNIVRALPQVVS